MITGLLCLDINTFFEVKASVFPLPISATSDFFSKILKSNTAMARRGISFNH